MLKSDSPGHKADQQNKLVLHSYASPVTSNSVKKAVCTMARMV